MNLDEIDKKLDKSSLLRSRDKSRIFGNIDTVEQPLSGYDTVKSTMDKFLTKAKIENLFNRPSSFYDNIKE